MIESGGMLTAAAGVTRLAPSTMCTAPAMNRL
jgi:hypothetical protein